MILQRLNNSHEHPWLARRYALKLMCAALVAQAASDPSFGQSADQPDDSPPPMPSLHFTAVIDPAPVDLPALLDDPADPGELVFKPGPIINAERPAPGVQQSPLTVLADLMLLRAQSPGLEPAETDAAALPDAADWFSLRFDDAAGGQSLWDNTDSIAGPTRWELLPDLFLRSGRVFDEGYESIDYADLYAELGVDLTSNTGISLRYERLRQALGSGREGEQVDADALYLQFELRF
jgi:hypothetical protein